MHSRHPLFPSRAPRPLTSGLARTTEITIREFCPRDGEAILLAFNRVFAGAQDGFCPRTLESWSWRFLENPAGGRVTLALDGDGQVLAQYAGLGVRVRLEGQEALISQSVDSFCDPRERGGLARAGLFVRTGEPYAELYGIDGEGEDRMMYGLPVPGAWRAGRDHLGYRFLSPLWRLEASAAALAAQGIDPGLRLEHPSQVPEGVGDLFDHWFDQGADAPAAAVLRDRPYLDWRYDRCPDATYRWLAVRRGGDLVGWLVLGSGRVDGSEAAWVLDHLVSPGDEPARRALFAAAGAQALEAGQSVVAMTSTDGNGDLGALQDLGLRVAPTGYFFAGRSYERARSVVWWAEHLALSLGDTDLA